MKSDLLVEIGVEELPPSSVLPMSNAFSQCVESHLRSHTLAHGEIVTYATPRRLALLIRSLESKSPDQEKVAWGPAVTLAFTDDGDVSRAGKAFADKNNLQVRDLRDYVANDGKQDKLCCHLSLEGFHTKEVIEKIINESLSELPIAKRMRWGDNRQEFVRPIQWAVLIYGSEVLQRQILGIVSGSTSRGHRFHAPGEIVIDSPGNYQKRLHEHYVIADFKERRDIIFEGVRILASELGGKAIIDELLLEEVTAITEWPVPLMGHFDEDFLSIPAEALISAMKEHQKYFHLTGSDEKLMAAFITVANLESSDPDQVKVGNERVIRSRLADAAFFYQNDLKLTLEQRRKKLSNVIYQVKLGSVFDKTERLRKLCRFLSSSTGSNQVLSERAAALSKSDLVSDMVGEFEDLQGVMGFYYATNDGEAPEVATAIYEQYLPRFANDEVPSSPEGINLALADRLDTLAGIFSIGEQPSGSKDPFAIRRTSLGLLKILLETNIDLDLKAAINFALEQIKLATAPSNANELALTYVLDRFISIYKEQGMPAENYKAVASLGLVNPLDINARVIAVAQFGLLPEAQSLISANKRVANILAKNSPKGAAINTSLLAEPAEVNLFKNLEEKRAIVQQFISGRYYDAALHELAKLSVPLDDFFATVMVMTDEVIIRDNRLALLHNLRQLFLDIADISLLSGTEKP